jgi:hypothetical protein
MCAVAIIRAGPVNRSEALRVLVRYGFATTAAVSIALVFVDHTAMVDRAAERRALESRAAELTTRAMTSGYALGCLDTGADGAIGTACQKAIFASPEATAAAVSYAAARFALLSDSLKYGRIGDPTYEVSIISATRAIERDPFGLYAHVLADRLGCTPDRCPAFAWLGEVEHLKAHLAARTFESLVEQYAASWVRASEHQVTSTPLTQRVPTRVNIDFPTAASIPPVSIMSPETPAPPASNGAPRRPAPQNSPPKSPANSPPKSVDTSRPTRMP